MVHLLNTKTWGLLTCEARTNELTCPTGPSVPGYIVVSELCYVVTVLTVYVSLASPINYNDMMAIAM